LSAASQNENEEFHKQKIRCPEGTAQGLRACSIWGGHLEQEFAMTAMAQALSRVFLSRVLSADERDTLKKIALFCGVGLLASLICMTYGLDLSPGFF
jgi:hypothetical protein